MCIAGIPVPIYQSEEELDGLRRLVLASQPESILEIGSLFGGTLWCWMHDSAPGATIVSVDTGVQSFDYRHEEVECARKLWLTWANSLGRNLVEIRADSRDPETVRMVAETGPFDSVFIDGGHDEATVWADLNNYWPMVKPNGSFWHSTTLPIQTTTRWVSRSARYGGSSAPARARGKSYSGRKTRKEFGVSVSRGCDQGESTLTSSMKLSEIMESASRTQSGRGLRASAKGLRTHFPFPCYRANRISEQSSLSSR
jgi:hypothetical protein